MLPSSEASAADDQGVASSRMSYSRFLVCFKPSHSPQIIHCLADKQNKELICIAFLAGISGLGPSEKGRSL